MKENVSVDFSNFPRHFCSLKIEVLKLSSFFSEFFGFLLLIIPPSLHTHLSPLHEVCDSPEQAARTEKIAQWGAS
jgi:hypothetical protein